MKEAFYMLIILLVFSASNAYAGIEEYLEKYYGVRVSQEQRDRLSQYNELIEYFCALPYLANGIEIHPDFIRALIIAESNGDPFAVSPKEAIGLTQIIYTTGKDAAYAIINNPDINLEQIPYLNRSQLERFSANNLYDPAVNIMLACYLIAKYNEDYQGHLDLVISAWNAGPGAITNGQPPEYQETLNLIGKVNGLFRFFLEENT